MQVALLQSREDPTQYVIDEDKKLGGFRSLLFLELVDIKGVYRAIKSYIAQLPVPEIPDLVNESDDALAGAYIILRDRKAAKNREAKVVAKNIDDAMNRITNEFLNRFTARKSTSIGIDGVGSVSRKKGIDIASTDWKTHYNYLLDRAIELRENGEDATEVFAALHKRLSIEPIEAYMDAHDGATPPGIEVKTKYSISVRKANSKGDEDYE